MGGTTRILVVAVKRRGFMPGGTCLYGGEVVGCPDGIDVGMLL